MKFKRLLTISEEIRVSVKKVDKKVEKKTEKIIQKVQENKDFSKSKLLATKELSKLTGINSRKINSWFTDNKLMYKKGDDWITTKRGKESGGVEKSGRYGQFIIWPEDIAKHITE